jgi:tetratricopeptide (TPR) repeat protein
MSNTVREPFHEWCRNAQRALARRDYAAVENNCRKILDADPLHAEGHFLLAVLALETRQIVPAARLAERAISLDNLQPHYHALMGRLLVMLQRFNEARVAAENAARLKPEEALTLDTIGCIYSHTGDHVKAIELFSGAVEREPTNPEYLFNLASSQRFLGDFDAAEHAYEKAIDAVPSFYKAHWSLAYLRTQSAASNHIDRLQHLLRKVSDSTDAKAMTHNALAKELDDIGDTDEAFNHLSASKSLIRQGMDYTAAEDHSMYACLTELFTKELLTEPVDGYPSKEPVFIVGMPRTGTTLVERILSSHTDVFSAGELRAFGLELKRAGKSVSTKVMDCETFEKGLEVNPYDLGQAYLESTRPATGHTKHFIDKTPLNCLNIGFIHRALPNAKIICLHRNPMDTCLSNFRHMFSPDSSPYYRYSFDLLETGEYYLLFRNLMEHWDTVLPGKILHVQYEEVVANQEAESRRIVEYCGLDWQDECLAFEKNTAPVATASSVQVRQPIYKDATARWKRYEHHLEPLKELFKSNGIDI